MSVNISLSVFVFVSLSFFLLVSFIEWLIVFLSFVFLSVYGCVSFFFSFSFYFSCYVSFYHLILFLFLSIFFWSICLFINMNIFLLCTLKQKLIYLFRPIKTGNCRPKMSNCDFSSILQFRFEIKHIIVLKFIFFC